ncbi:hypothetical protein [Gloeothece verrucosa]|uniref:Uncharacterized protein n=1 Tax=Gloeothece verrucosa (strain PCC 7822) TaxID=497965 RepID=E0U8X6_GLOV7|nr:hypothetical protein [Gloeothece verrucosa]ADN16115.1 conserved hypothetical protein [Gloeothece verrucosa PCC 7822]
MNNLEQQVLETFRKLSVEKQNDVLEFLELIEQEPAKDPTDEELRKAREIINKAKQRARSSAAKSAPELWKEFNQIKNLIADQYEDETKSS